MSDEMIAPGGVEWFPAADWSADSYIWRKDGDVWLSLMIAAQPGTGALSRLMREIWRRGLRVVVPCPMPQMRHILIAKGFAPEAGHPCEVLVKEASRE